MAKEVGEVEYVVCMLYTSHSSYEHLLKSQLDERSSPGAVGLILRKRASSS